MGRGGLEQREEGGVLGGGGCRGQGGAGGTQAPSADTPPLPPRSFLSREDIGIILISQCLAELIRHAVEAHARPLPAVLEIPSKEHPYDPTKDSVLRRARGLFTPDDLR